MAIDGVANREPSREELAYVEFQAAVNQCLKALEGDSSRWFGRLYRTLLKEKDRLSHLSEDQQGELFGEIDEVLGLMVEWARPDGEKRKPTDRSSTPTFSEVQTRIHELEHLMQLPNKETTPLVLRKISLEEMERVLPDQLEYTQGENLTIRFRAAAGEAWTEVAVPKRDDLFYKGGLPRILLKLLAGAPSASLRAEIPMNDIDMIAWPGENDRQEILDEALRLGADLEGVEMTEEKDMEKVLKVRDVSINQCFLGKDGLVFSDKALRAMQTGVVEIMDPLDRGLYGSESFVFDGIKLVKNRGMYRLFKFVVEGKASSFEQVVLNRQIDLGIYWLVLARKFAAKKNAGTLLNRFYELGKRAGQVRDGEENIIDVLTRVHGEYSFFTFDDTKQSEDDIVRWLGRKLAKMANRKFRITRGVSSGLSFERTAGDDTPEHVSLEGYVDNSVMDAQTRDAWQLFAGSRRGDTNTETESQRATA